jgi:hypothetical protein
MEKVRAWLSLVTCRAHSVMSKAMGMKVICGFYSPSAYSICVTTLCRMAALVHKQLPLARACLQSV